MRRLTTDCDQHNAESRALFGPSYLIYRMDACIDSCSFDHHSYVPAFLGLIEACRSSTMELLTSASTCIIFSQELRIFDHLLE